MGRLRLFRHRYEGLKVRISMRIDAGVSNDQKSILAEKGSASYP
jgi:hypothetical protein